MIRLGISPITDSAVAITRGHEILFAAHEERYSRRKHDNRFPINAIRAGLKECNLAITDIDLIIYYENPRVKLLRLLKSAITTFPEGRGFYTRALITWVTQNKLRIRTKIKKELTENFGVEIAPIKYGKHHECMPAAYS